MVKTGEETEAKKGLTHGKASGIVHKGGEVFATALPDPELGCSTKHVIVSNKFRDMDSSSEKWVV